MKTTVAAIALSSVLTLALAACNSPSADKPAAPADAAPATEQAAQHSLKPDTPFQADFEQRIFTRSLDYILKTPKVVSGTGAFRLALMARPSTSRVWAGSITPSSHRRAVA